MWRSGARRSRETRVSKSFQFVVGGFQLCSPFDNALFQLFIELANFLLVSFSLRDVAKRHHAAAHCSVFVFQGAAADLNPGSLLELGIAHKHLGRT